ncbi:MAG TPA: Na(+)/H(+) antiporter subunit C [Candidatus Nesterenkonia stercoripullorum]|uniref:Na(+)/H(+) antiporter subunit C n=1 Tax=Candidatus Nesterenkonia stercoripullorum TaxID=2838701 RepID=A0A9D1USU2_9MICC|nr:Na(+)/H(+) antiporter subunit C [Candidatus Nesterenkonia stercoripullorum]
MTVNLTLLIVMGVMFAAGIYLLLERSLTRVLLGVILISNGANLLLLQVAGRAGLAPLVQNGVESEEYFDPLPQALLLTAIVIAFALVSFMLALIYRSWVLARRDEVADDLEDQRVARQEAYDAEEDAPVIEETSEFIEDDPNEDYELVTRPDTERRHGTAPSSRTKASQDRRRSGSAEGGRTDEGGR